VTDSIERPDSAKLKSHAKQLEFARNLERSEPVVWLESFTPETFFGKHNHWRVRHPA